MPSERYRDEHGHFVSPRATISTPYGIRSYGYASDDNCTVCNRSIRYNGGTGCCNNTCYLCYRAGHGEHNHCSRCNAMVIDPACSNCGSCEDCASDPHEYCLDDTHCRSCCSCLRGPIQESACQSYPAKQPAIASNNYLYLGVELEVEFPDREDKRAGAEHILAAHKQDILIKADGSLRNGFEMVTGPLGLTYHQALWPVLAKKALQVGARSWNYTSTGLHVHLSRAFFTPLTLGKFITFINSERHRGDVIRLAGRENPSYAMLEKKKVKCVARNVRFGNRYEAVNLTNAHTIEVRIFKGTLYTPRIIADIEFCHAVAMYVRDESIDTFEDWGRFAGFVENNRKTYKYLASYLRLGRFPRPTGRNEELAAAAIAQG